MQYLPYSYNKELTTRYTFKSKGRKVIDKVVEFSPTEVSGIYNLGFGDLLLNGSIDDTANSNNGDIIKVLATVIAILKDFSKHKQEVKIVFTGSTQERLNLYHRILKTYYSEFSKEFIISGLIKIGRQYKEVTFEPQSRIEYLAFFIKRIT